ncbi:MAG: response regulator [Chloroflexi bacterium]|nr:response regulator [Chloroflexota bacterium]
MNKQSTRKKIPTQITDSVQPKGPVTESILIVDDNPINVHLLSHMLEHQGYKIQTADSGHHALKSIRANPPDLILLDIMMPDMDGYEVCKQLKDVEQTRDTPIIFISALDATKNKIRGFEVGGVDYITKPFQFAEVLARVAIHLTLRNMQKKLEEQNLKLEQEIRERVRAEEQLWQRNRELTTLYEASTIMKSNLSLDVVLKNVAMQMTHALNASGCTLSLWHRERNQVETLVDYSEVWNEDELDSPGTMYDLGDYPVTRQALETGQPIVIQSDDSENNMATKIALLAEQHVQTLFMLPLTVQNHTVGLVELNEAAKKRDYTQDEIRLAQSLAIQAAVAIHNAQLYEQVKQQRETLRQYTTDLETQNAELDAFAHTVAHDLKNPLTALITTGFLLENHFTTLSQEDIRLHTRMVTQNGRMMNNIIDELLLLASVREIDEIDTQQLDMGDIVTNAQNRLAFSVEEQQAEIILPNNWPIALGYGPWIEEVWANYISNAIKYGGQQPRIELGGTLTADGWVRFWVRDNGLGLTPEEQERLFTPFERLHQVRAEGHGLGLSIVQRIVEKLGGQVGVESTVGQGSVFFFTLPGE